MINKIIEYCKKNLNFFIFAAIFCMLTFLYNQNSQTLNYVLKRGTILEYSIDNSLEINKTELKQKFNSLYIKYSFIEKIDNSEFESYDFEQKQIKKTLLIGLPFIAKEDKKVLFDEISDYIFENYPNSELIDLKTLNYFYNEPYSAILIFLSILALSVFIWLILMYLIYDIKTINQKIKTRFLEYLNKQKTNFKNIYAKTKEKGFGYLIKRILLDSAKDDNEDVNITKEIISTIVFVLIAVIVIRYFIGELRWIPSGSMRPTILEHDRVFVEKLDFPKKEIKRGDILVFYPPATQLSNSPMAIFARLSGIFCKDIAYIKRTVGLPGEKFEIKQNQQSGEYRVYINDVPLNEPYISSKSEWTPCADNMYCGPFIIPENSYFMMGDNRNNSQDSRFWGFLEGDRIIGRANFMFWPIKRINILKDKYINLHKNKSENYTYILNRYEN